jgi:hypothetical protein
VRNEEAAEDQGKSGKRIAKARWRAQIAWLL